MFTVMFVIVPFQDEIEKGLYQSCTVIINSFVIFIALYGQKAFRIIAYPHQNTRSYFQDCRMADMRKKAQELKRL